VLGDSVYGSDKSLRVMLESHDMPYVLSVRGNERLMMGDFRTHTAEDLAAALSADEWRRLPAGQGSKEPRLYDWARVRLFRLQSPPWDHWLLIRRSIVDPTDMAFYVTFGPDDTELPELAAVAGLRWTIEECFQSAKGETGLDHCEARSWHGWHRHITLSMLALAFLAGLRARLREVQIDAAFAGIGQSGDAVIRPAPSARTIESERNIYNCSTRTAESRREENWLRLCRAEIALA
jgi:SRSO17 transposase